MKFSAVFQLLGKPVRPTHHAQSVRCFSSSYRSQGPSKPGQMGYDHEQERGFLDNGSRDTSRRTPLTDISMAARPGSSSEGFLNRVRDAITTPYQINDPPHHLHLYSHKHNTHITLTRPDRNPMLSVSCGNIGFRHAQRGGFDPAHQLSSYVMAKIQERGFLMEIKRLEVVLRGFGPGREAFTKVLLGVEGGKIREKVVRVTDATRLKFGGTRSRGVRRL